MRTVGVFSAGRAGLATGIAGFASVVQGGEAARGIGLKSGSSSEISGLRLAADADLGTQ